jgi:Uncharacterized conserved protein
VLTLTDNAVAVIRDLTQQQEEGAGLRIASDPSSSSLMLSVAPTPQEGDEVIDTEGARLFLDAEAAPLLDDKYLDASIDAGGGVRFALAEQPA